MQKITTLLIIIITLALSGPVNAADDTVADKRAVANITARLKTLAPDMKPTSIKKSPVPGIYEVIMDLRQLYITANGRYLIPEGIIDLENDKGIASANLNKAIIKSIDAVGDDNMIEFGGKKSKHTVTVFTDIDCGYCRKLHSEMAGYNNEGIRIRYLFYPRAGIPSSSYKKAVSVWCAKNRNKALTEAKLGHDVEAKNCDNPVKEHFELGKRIGLNGTPAMVLESGEVLPGYIPPKRLALYLDKK